ncbi:hypothetical protein [Geosporobacter ferrireducens]|uniref:Stage III sporulation protein AG n=1 Tax=Geosporobacter ferrireducens TaxID=1424294 RepID=A0A1D8GB88_9FIRM|nr:hypothetical protein [Geosporobacter ferrireducens]AOT68158.1 hypothetical protein Gferi_00310 [Geosporobacter ferrireducens]MTI54207.1 stage III sporulation protein AG [Geosporobacter ferrireducens]
MKINEKFNELLQKMGHKKMIYNLVAIVIICIIALITWDTFFPGKLEGSLAGNAVKQEQGGENFPVESYRDSLETQLKNILSQIKGVGQVEVMVTYESSVEVVPASNTTRSQQQTQEKDAQGGTRTTTQEELTQNIVTNSSTGNSGLLVIKEIKPQIRGVVVVAEGAGDVMVKTELVDAVKTIFQIPAHKVMVYEKKID